MNTSPTLSKPLSPNSIPPTHLASRLQQGLPSRILDVRSAAEFQTAHLAASSLQPINTLNPADWKPGDAPLFVLCQSGGRATRAAQMLCEAGVACSVVEGGLDAWMHAGLPVVRGASKVLPLMRQVQLVIGFFTALGAALALWVDPRFAWVALFTGCGLLMAGLTGLCPLANLIAAMPWNAKPGGTSPANALGVSTGGASCCAGPDNATH